MCAYHEQAYSLSPSGGVQRGEAPLPRVWGVSPRFHLFPPHDWGPRGLKTDFSEDLQRIDEA